MRSVIICCSISVADEALRIQKELDGFGLEVEIPVGVKKYIANNFTHATKEESAKDKKDNDLIRGYYEKMKSYDAVLIVNAEKNGIANYIGGNTFLEMAFAHVLNKSLYVLNPLPECSYLDELRAMDPVILDGDLSRLKKDMAGGQLSFA